MDTPYRTITSVGMIVRKICPYCQTYIKGNAWNFFTDTNRSPHDPERNRRHSQQQTPNICGKRNSTYITEFFGFLRERQEANKRKTPQTTATEGDIVLVYDDTSSSTWKTGRIEELFKEMTNKKDHLD